MSTTPPSIPESDAAPAAGRERGWRLILPALGLFLLVPAFAALRVIFPVEQTILLVGPAIGVCALVAWVQGGRVWLALTWLLLSAWMLLRPPGAGSGFEFLARGWAIVLVSMFGIVCMLGGRRLFLSRALSAVAATFVFAGAVVLVSDVSTGRVQRTLADELDRRAAPLNAQVQATTMGPEWQNFADSNPRFAALVEQMLESWNRMPEVTVSFFPALLALESLAALALAWGLFHRISRTRVGPPLQRLRDFKFGDQLVWGFLVGIVLVVIPSLDALRGLGVNLILFFGALYVLRGLGVLAWFMADRRLAIAMLILLALLFTPAVGILALGLGLGDTWVDWRGRARQQLT
ncbi:MAG TPA: DUF2232 domain-containing protein [Gemmatimonadaceae bacterium]|nr:DUF2232 domain-containing protein [Gemmatimonadaceae bacterium]